MSNEIEVQSGLIDDKGQHNIDSTREVIKAPEEHMEQESGEENVGELNEEEETKVVKESEQGKNISLKERAEDEVEKGVEETETGTGTGTGTEGDAEAVAVAGNELESEQHIDSKKEIKSETEVEHIATADSEIENTNRAHQEESQEETKTSSETRDITRDEQDKGNKKKGIAVDMNKVVTGDYISEPKTPAPLPSLVFVLNSMKKLQESKNGRRKENKEILEKCMGILEGKVEGQRDGEAEWMGIEEARTLLEGLEQIGDPSKVYTDEIVLMMDIVEKLVSFRMFSRIAKKEREILKDSEKEKGKGKGREKEKAEEYLASMGERAKDWETPVSKLTDRMVGIVCRAFSGSSTSEVVQLQIVKALLAITLSKDLEVHQGSLLRGVRTVINVYLLGVIGGNEAVASGALFQMIGAICGRAEKTILEMWEKGRQKTGEVAVRDVFLIFWALSKFSMRKDNIHEGNHEIRMITESSRLITLQLMSTMLSQYTELFSEGYLYLKSDGGKEQTRGDMRDELKAHTPGLLERMSRGRRAEAEEGERNETAKEIEQAGHEIQAAADEVWEKEDGQKGKGEGWIPLIVVVKQYLSILLSRNLVATNIEVLDVTISMFEVTLVDLRSFMKQEIEVMMKEIVFPILAMKHVGSVAQRERYLMLFERILRDPSLVVELYLNYDCDQKSQVQVFQRLAEQLCRISGGSISTAMWPEWSRMNTSGRETAENYLWKKVQDEETSIFRTAGLKKQKAEMQMEKKRRTTQTYSQSSAKSSSGTRNMVETTSGEYNLRQSALNSLTAMLQSMVLWSDRMMINTGSGQQKQQQQQQQQGFGEPQRRRTESMGKIVEEEVDASGSEASMSRVQTRSTIGVEQQDDKENIEKLFENRKRKEKYSKYIAVFNKKPSRGIRALVEDGFIESSEPEAIARFLQKASVEGQIDKMKLGEYLGEKDETCEKVMHQFVDLNSFEGLTITDALRKFLQGFRLPGEAQKIDRIMQKFAEKYVEENKENSEFANAQAAYVLAFSIIMLNTDLHSAQVKNKMTKEQFFKNNRGINNGADLNPEYLDVIYEDIRTNEIKLLDDPLRHAATDLLIVGNGAEAGGGGGGGANTFFDQWRRGRQAHSKLAMLMKERSTMMATKSEQRIRAIFQLDSTLNARWYSEMVQFTVATRAEHVSAMFEAVWAPVLAALSSPLQTSRDPRVIYECLVGMQCGVTLACRFRLPLERAAYVSSLSRFTVLGSHILGSGAGSGGSLGGSGSGSGSSLSGGISGDNLESSSASITNKQLEATRALLEVALLRPDVGNGLQDDWMPVLQCVSLLERLSLLENPVVNSAYGSAATSLGNSPNQSITGITTPNSNITYDESLNPQNHSYERNTIDNNGVGGIGNGGYNPDETPASRFDSPGVNSIDDANFFVSPNPNVASVFANTPNSEIVEARKSISAANLKTFVRQTYSYVLGLVVDRIFVTSVNLSGNGIVDFVKAISIVAMDEITLTKSSSLYSRKSVYDSNLDHIHTRSHYNPNSNSNSNSNLNTNTNPNSNLNTNTNTNTNTNLNPNLNSHLQHTAVSSHQGSTPPLHMLTRIVEIARYNMARIRFEWSHIWAVLGDLFDRAGSHPNTQVAIFTLDSLRQLSQDFLDLDLDEVLDFQFQKQFLRPFVTVLEHQCNLVVVTNGHMTQVGDLTVKDMVLRCLKQLVEAKHSKLRSGWKAVLLASKTAAYDSDLLISELGLDLVLLAAKHIHLHFHANTTSNNNPSNNVDSNFTELIQTLTDYGVQSLQPKLSLAAVDQLSLLFNRNPHFSILLSLHRIVKTSDDLEVRSSALDSIYLLAKSNHLFFFSDQSTTESTTTPTTTTTPKNNFILFLDTIAFDLFSSFNGNSSLHSEQVELYISTTLVKALRHLIDLFVHLLNEEKDKPSCTPIFLEKLLDLLSSCICFSRETSVNSGGETLCRIGAACLQDLVDKTKSLLDTSSQFLVVRTFTKVMDYSLPYLLFDVLSPNSPILSSADEKSVEGENNIPTAPSDKSQKELYHEITLSCVLHLQLINTIGDIFISPLFNCHQSFLSDNLSNSIPIQHTQQHSTSSLSSNLPKSIYGLSLPTYPSLPFTNDSYTFDNLLILLNALESSRQFSRRFNTNLRLRTMLVECGVMPQLPSLTRQESCSTMASLMLLIKLYNLYSGDSEKLSVIISRLAGMASDILDCYSYTFGHSSDSVNESEEKAGTDALSFDLSMYPENSFYSLCKPTQTKKAYNSNGAKLSISSENHVTDEQTDDETDDDNNSRTSTNNRNGVTKKSINSTTGAGAGAGTSSGGGGVFQGYSANLLNFLNNGQRTNYRYSVVALLTFFVSEISRHISVQKTNEKDNSKNNKNSGSIGDDNDPFDLVVEHVMKPAYPSLVRLLNCHMHFAGDNVLLVHLQVFLGVFGEYCFSLACK